MDSDAIRRESERLVIADTPERIEQEAGDVGGAGVCRPGT
jgi:hypothetical protein